MRIEDIKILVLENKKIAVIGLGVFTLLLITTFIFSSVKNAAAPDLPFTIPAYGMLGPLDQEMDNNAAIDERVKRVISYDPVFLFANYKQVNGDVAEILFLWSGITAKELQSINSRTAINTFLRRSHALPDNVPVQNNPVLGDKPWPTLFNRFKSRLLMLGQGHKIYKGRAYYDSVKDKMVIEGVLSKDFVKTFGAFVKTLPPKNQKSFINNFLVFIDETKGLKNITEKEKELLRANLKF